MRSYPLTALVLRKTKLGETDIIVTLLAEDGRQVRAVAKGLRKPGSRFGGRLEPYNVVDLLLHSGRSLEIVAEARTVATHAGLGEDLDRSAAAAVVVDLLDKIAVEGQTEPRLFGLAQTTLSVMETCDPKALPALVVSYLVKAMAMHGYRPELEECATCGGSPSASGSFSLPAGGTVCGACAELDPGALCLPDAARAWLSRMLGSTMAEIAEADIPEAAIRDCFTLIRGFVGYHLPARLKALEFYASMLP